MQEFPGGLAQAFTIGADFIGDESVALVLGDNIFHGVGLGAQLNAETHAVRGGRVFAYQVADPGAYGVVEFDDQGHVLSIEEKPIRPKSRFAVPGLYFYDERVVEVARGLKPSDRGELTVTVLERGTAWLDTGTFTSLMQAAEYVRVVEERQGHKIGCIEEVAWRAGFITRAQMHELAEALVKSGYGHYLLNLD